MLKRQPKPIDKVLLTVIVIILIFGLIMLFSASVAVGMARFADGSFFIKRQLFALLIGSLAMFFTYRTDYHVWQKWSFLLFAANLFLLLLVIIPGIGVSGLGAQRWIDLRFVKFQPSEIAKLTLVLYLSAWLAERRQWIAKDFKQGLLPFIGLLAILFFLIIKQPDMGTLIVICFIGVSLYFAAGANLSHLFWLLAACFFLIVAAIKVAPYRLARILSFFNPSADPQGSGYHITQALLAIASGGIFGLGLGHSRQKFFYLPEVIGDSLFAVIAEELGFIFSAFLIILFLLFLWRGAQIAKNAPDTYGKLVAFGITIWIVGQAFINIAAMLAILPLTGLPLPFMSYGGNALVAGMAGIGVLLNIAKQSRI